MGSLILKFKKVHKVLLRMNEPTFCDVKNADFTLYTNKQEASQTLRRMWLQPPISSSFPTDIISDQ